MTEERTPIRQIIDGLIEVLNAEDDFKTLIIGVLAGDEKEVKTTEKEFDIGTDDLLSKNVFVKLTGFRGLKEGN